MKTLIYPTGRSRNGRGEPPTRPHRQTKRTRRRRVPTSSVQFEVLANERNAAVPAVGVRPKTAGTAALRPSAYDERTT